LQQQKRDDNLVNRAMQAMFQQAKDLQRLFGENLGDQSALMRSASPELLQSIVHVQTHAMMLTQLSRTALASNVLPLFLIFIYYYFCLAFFEGNI
jgi:hypothetical protein